MAEEENWDDILRIHWNSPHFYQGKQIIVPRLFDGKSTDVERMEGYNGITLRLDAQMTADLDWKAICVKAEELKRKGFFIFWDIDLGLFQRPLDDQTQFLSLSLALEHFQDFFWKDFQECTLGVSLYRGSADFSPYFQWNEIQLAGFQEWMGAQSQNHMSFDAPFIPEILQQSEQGRHFLSLFCRNVVSEYLHLLANRLPDEMLLCLLLDASTIKDPLKEAQILSKAVFDRFHLGIKNPQIPHAGLSWKDASIEKTHDEECRIGICLPPAEKEILSLSSELGAVLQDLLTRKVHFKAIPEELLISEWDGLDYLLVASQSLGHQGKRKLQGFCAAGGTCVIIGEPIGLSTEIPFSNWLEDNHLIPASVPIVH